jgi:hypothetical protein
MANVFTIGKVNTEVFCNVECDYCGRDGVGVVVVDMMDDNTFICRDCLGQMADAIQAWERACGWEETDESQ